MTIPAIIAARGGSKGIPRKNLKKVGDRPLIAHTIEAATDANSIGRTIVTTDDEEIAEVSREYGAEVPFIRPEELAGDDVPVIAAFKHAVEYLAENGESSRFVVGLQPTCPFTDSNDIDTAVEKATETDCDSVVSVAEVTETHPYRAYELVGDRVKPLEGITETQPDQRQDRPDVYGFTGAIFVRKSRLLQMWSGNTFALGDDVRGIVQPPERALDIDTRFELRIARALYEYDSGVPAYE